MTEIVSDTIQEARKSYSCDACHLFIKSGLGHREIRSDDWLTVEKAKADKCQVLPKTKYRKVVYRDGGKLVMYRARIDMDLLCYRNDLFDE